MYQPLNTDAESFNKRLNTITSKFPLTNDKEVIIGMDHNLDLLKSSTNRHTQQFIEEMTEKILLPTITQPTRITNSSATLIDNIFVSEKLHRFYESVILLDDMSDHLPMLTLLKQTKLLDKEPLEFESQNLTDKKITAIKNDLLQVDWTSTLTGGNSDQNFDIFLATVNRTMDKISPIKKMKISAKCRFVEPWMTRGLEISSRKKKELYKATLKNGATQESKLKYIEYRNKFNKTKRSMQKLYFTTRANDFAKDSKKLRSLINNVIKRTKDKVV